MKVKEWKKVEGWNGELVLSPSSTQPTSISMATALAHHKHASIIAAIKALDAAAVTLKSEFSATPTRTLLEKTASVSRRSRQQRAAEGGRKQQRG